MASRFVMKNRRIFAIRKMEALENAAVIWISNSRFAIRNGARWGRREEWRCTEGPVALSYKVTTDVNMLVNCCQEE